MLGSMQDWPLVVPAILDHAARFHGGREMVTRTVEGPLARTNYTQLHSRARRVAKALTRRGIRLGDRVGTLAWNTARLLRPGTASWGSAPSATRSTRASSPSRSPTSSIMPR